MSNSGILRDLGDGLILRRATVNDLDALLELHRVTLQDPGEEEAHESILKWTRELMMLDHPTFEPGDFTVVENTETGAFVSSLCLIPQTWSYEGIPFGVGRPELVCTHPDYRRRGLIRAQFETIHAWCAERDLPVQAITGIPWYYRQFGYEMAMELGGGRSAYRPHIPKLKEDQEEPFQVRPAKEADLPFIAEVYAAANKRSPIVCVRDEAMWRYELIERDPESANARQLRVIEAKEGEPVGLLGHPGVIWDIGLAVTQFELKPGIPWTAVAPSVFRYLEKTGDAYAEKDEKFERCEAFAFRFGSDHPMYRAMDNLLPREHKPYAWYMRVPDIPGFLRHIKPVLEKRLSDSIVVGHTGELKISFYRSGLRLVFDAGELTEIEAWQPTVDERGDAAFPDLTFLHLLFGHRTLQELVDTFADCWAWRDVTREVLRAIFPKRPSCVWPVS
jgi:hypothetical protein